MHIGDKIAKFPDNDDGIYLSKPDNIFRKVSEEKKNMIEGLNNFKTMGAKKKGFRKFQYKTALLAIKLYHMVGAPNLRNLKTMIRQNIIQNFPVTVEDIEITEDIFGPYVSTLKIITMRQRPKLVMVPR